MRDVFIKAEDKLSKESFEYKSVILIATSSSSFS